MRFQIRRWFLLCITVALAASHLGRIWSPATGEFLTKPMWVFEESMREENEHALALLCGPAPEIDSKVSVQELFRVLHDDYLVTLDPNAVNGFDSVGRMNCHVRFNGQKLGNWMLDILKPLELDLVVERGQIQIVDKKQIHDDDHRMIRIYPSPKVSSNCLIRSIESSCGSSNWLVNGGEDSISLVDNDHQSLLIVSTDYSTHQQVEGYLKNFYRTSGIGWRNEALILKQLPDVLMGRLAWLLAFPNTPSSSNTGFGCGYQF